MTRAIALGITTILLSATGCDPEGGEPEDDIEFRQNVTYVQVQTTNTTFKSKGCDPDWWMVEAATKGAYDEKEWRSMVAAQAKMMGEEMLTRAFLANPENQALCHDACLEFGGKWTGNARPLESKHAVGEVEVVGECPLGTLATSTPVTSQGEMGCECG